MSVIILTPDGAGESASPRWPSVLDRMVAPLTAAGIDVEGRSWTAAGDLSGKLVLPLLCWGYHQAGQLWHDRIEAWAAEGVMLRNSASVLRWNSDKQYLERLASNGAPTVPTRFVEKVDAEALGAATKAFQTDQLVVKPQVSAGAWRTIRWSPGEPFDHGPPDRAMVQPYLPSIETEGEISLLYFGGQFSHAIRKIPQPGDFRVQPEYEGIITAHAPCRDERAAGDAILAAVEEDLLYARIDLVRGLDGKPALIELELVEPDLYLGYDADASARFVQAVKAALQFSPSAGGA